MGVPAWLWKPPMVWCPPVPWCHGATGGTTPCGRRWPGAEKPEELGCLHGGSGCSGCSGYPLVPLKIRMKGGIWGLSFETCFFLEQWYTVCPCGSPILGEVTPWSPWSATAVGGRERNRASGSASELDPLELPMGSNCLIVWDCIVSLIKVTFWLHCRILSTNWIVDVSINWIVGQNWMRLFVVTICHNVYRCRISAIW